ncbi:MAG: hypothetical protein WCK40_08875 [Thermoleophilia bacterium]
MGRPTNLTPALTTAVGDLLREGATRSSAFASIGIAPATGAEWIRRGEDRDDRPGGDLYATFAAQVRGAEADHERRMLALIDHAATASPADWRAAAWILERRYPNRWSARRQIDAPATEQPLTLLRLADLLDIGDGRSVAA